MRFDIQRLSLAMACGLMLALAACGGPAKREPEAPAPAAAPPVETAPAQPAETETPAPAVAAAPAPGTAVYADYAGDAVKGKRVFAQCMACHMVAEGRNNVGPSLFGIVGRESGTVADFKYSDANASSDVIWTEENLFTYLEKPQAFIPGTIMSFAGLRNPQDRADLIAYLKAPT
jgi:cytochrome c